MYHKHRRSIRRIGFVSTRVSGTDGVSLEVGKWAEILERMGYDCYFICGQSDRPPESTFLIEEADFKHPSIEEIHRKCFGRTSRVRQMTQLIESATLSIKNRLYDAIEQLQLDMLIAENALTIPMNLPLGIALLETLLETEIPCIAHHHDFVWERERFLVNGVEDYIAAAFPPRVSHIHHVVINSVAGGEFGRRTGLPYIVVPNVMNFDQPPSETDAYALDFRETIGVGDDDILVLQPTRVVQRKGIEHGIELVNRLGRPNCKFVITHNHDDEGLAYYERLQKFAEIMDVDVVFAKTWICHQRRSAVDGKKCYTIWDSYRHADLISYPSSYEGFGNAFLEAIYYKRPIFCNRYAIFRTDIEPMGFRSVVMDGFVTEKCLDEVRRVLDDEEYCREMVDHNYEVAKRCFSYTRVETQLRAILASIQGG